jgi:hypothetical protein
MANPNVTGTPVVTAGDGNPVDWNFTWTNGSIAATLPQAIKGINDMITAQIQAGNINSDSTVTVNPDNTFSLHISKDVSVLFFTQTVIVDCSGTVAASADGKSTVFNMSNGGVQAGGNASQSQVVQALQTQVAAWEAQAQKEVEPPAPPAAPADRELG